MSGWWQCSNNVLTLYLHIQPGAKQEEVVGIYNDRLKIRLKVPPIEGRANKALIKFLAKTFDVPASQIEVLQGIASRQKTVKIRGSTVNPESIFNPL